MYVCTLGTFKSLPSFQSSPFPPPPPPFSKEKALETRLFESKTAASLPTLRSLTETRFQPLIYDCTSPLSYF